MTFHVFPDAPLPDLAPLASYAALLRQWNPRINLVSPATLAELETRHLADCAQLIKYLPQESVRIADIGSGAGLPGIVLATLAPQHHFTLIESDQRKAAFLLTAARTLGLQNVRVANCRVEAFETNEFFQIITARAFAPLERLLPQTRPLLAPGGHWLLLKGEAVDEELRVCETLFLMTTRRHRSTLLGKDGRAGWVLEVMPAT